VTRAVAATVLRRPDGRHLAFAEYGDPAGDPLFVFHGTPGSRLQVAMLDGPARRRHLRVIAPDRPGYGLSDYQPDRTLPAWGDEVAAIADHLGLDRFAVLGVSGGAPHALACAAVLGDRVTRVEVVSAVAPPECWVRGARPARLEQAVSFLAVTGTRWVALLAALIIRLVRRTPRLALMLYRRLLPRADRRITHQATVLAGFREEIRRFPVTTPRAIAQDLALFSAPWGFELDEITAPVDVWQGGRDRAVPLLHAEELARRLGVEVRRFPHDGHLMMVERADPILARCEVSGPRRVGAGTRVARDVPCRRPSFITLLLVLVLVLGLSACGGADGGSSPSPSDTTAPTTAPPTTPTETPTTATVPVDVFFMNEAMGDPCSEVFPVRREVPAAAPLRGALEELLAGPTAAERGDGYNGWFSDATAHLLAGVRMDGTRALVSFRRELPEVIPNASSSCGSIGLLAQLDHTATQFPGVAEAWYDLEGDRADFYGWLQFAAPDDPGPLPKPTPSPIPTEIPEPTPTASPPGPTPAPTTAPPGARGVPPSLVGTEWTSLPVTDRVVALTFDAGANGDAVPSILVTLEAEGVPATFFLTGRWVTAYPSYSQAIGARYPVGNHTQSHPDLTSLGDAEVRAQIEDAGGAIAAATGRDPHPWFRFPYGARDARTIDLANSLGYGSVRWSVDTLGWKGTSGGVTAASVVDRVLGDLHPGQIVLMHVGSHPTDGSTLDADALPTMVQRIRDAGYGFVDLDALLPGVG
jgi:peptidoglycan/xylan/chitin deacetylase (PgdA/CDA1 family)/pimeloyl-ACP methyl ester carboxylesterase